MEQEEFDKLTPAQRRQLIDRHFGGVEDSTGKVAPPKRSHVNREDEHVRQHILPFLIQRFHVNVTSVIGVKPTGVSPGIPDLYCQSAFLKFWFEAKLPGNRQSEAQHNFLQRCLRGNEFYAMGTIAEAKAFLTFYDRKVAEKVDDIAYAWYLSDEYAKQFEEYGWRPPRKLNTAQPHRFGSAT